MNNTPNINFSAERPLKQIKIPTIPGATIRWNSQTINDIAKSAGMTKVAFCDRRIFSILRGIWSTDYIIVYGE